MIKRKTPIKPKKTNRIIWKKYEENRFSSGEDGFIGKVKIFCIYWSLSGTSNTPYRLQCNLPGIKMHIGFYGSIEKGEEYAEKVLSHWLKITGIEI